MPRIVEERLEGYAFGVSHKAPSNGDSKDAEVMEIVFQDDPDHPSHVITVAFTADGKRALLEHVTGGIAFASHIPPG